MKLTLEKAKQIKSVFLDEIERNRTIPGNMVQPFFDYYNGEFKPGTFAQIPCSCSPKIWIEMIKDVTNAVNEALETEASNVVETVEAQQVELEAAKKKSKKVKETVAVDDKKEEDEETV
jgi:hypothetical protein